MKVAGFATELAMKFNGSSGRKPQTEARRYVYGVLATAIENDGEDMRGWLFGGLEDEVDRRRVEKAAKAVVKEFRRKAKA